MTKKEEVILKKEDEILDEVEAQQTPRLIPKDLPKTKSNISLVVEPEPEPEPSIKDLT